MYQCHAILTATLNTYNIVRSFSSKLKPSLKLQSCSTMKVPKYLCLRPDVDDTAPRQPGRHKPWDLLLTFLVPFKVQVELTAYFVLDFRPTQYQTF